YGEKEAIGQSKFDLLVPPEEQKDARARLRGAIEKGSTVYDGVRRRQDGTRIFVAVAVQTVRGAGGRVESLVMNERDVTLLKYARDAQMLQTRFRGVL